MLLKLVIVQRQWVSFIPKHRTAHFADLLLWCHSTLLLELFLRLIFLFFHHWNIHLLLFLTDQHVCSISLNSAEVFQVIWPTNLSLKWDQRSVLLMDYLHRKFVLCLLRVHVQLTLNEGKTLPQNTHAHSVSMGTKQPLFFSIAPEWVEVDVYCVVCVWGVRVVVREGLGGAVLNNTLDRWKRCTSLNLIII